MISRHEVGCLHGNRAGGRAGYHHEPALIFQRESWYEPDNINGLAHALAADTDKHWQTTPSRPAINHDNVRRANVSLCHLLTFKNS